VHVNAPVMAWDKKMIEIGHLSRPGIRIHLKKAFVHFFTFRDGATRPKRGRMSITRTRARSLRGTDKGVEMKLKVK